MTRLPFLVAATLLVAGCGQRNAARESSEPARTEAPEAAPDSAPVEARTEVRPGTAVAVPPVARLQVPVTLHSPDESLDACSWGAVRPWRGPAGDSVDVRSGPGTRYPVVDRLPTGHEFGLCDGKNGWTGVVYRPQGVGEGLDCGPLGTPVPEPLEYRGPCKSGWVSDEKVEVTAG